MAFVHVKIWVCPPKTSSPSITPSLFFPFLYSTQLKFIEKGSRMAKRTQYIKTNQMINVNEIFKKTNKTNDKNSSVTESLSMYNHNTIFSKSQYFVRLLIFSQGVVYERTIFISFSSWYWIDSVPSKEMDVLLSPSLAYLITAPFHPFHFRRSKGLHSRSCWGAYSTGMEPRPKWNFVYFGVHI